MKALVDKIHAVDSCWRISGFIIDDPALETDPIRHVFISEFISLSSAIECSLCRLNLYTVSLGMRLVALFFSLCGVFEDHG